MKGWNTFLGKTFGCARYGRKNGGIINGKMTTEKGVI